MLSDFLRLLSAGIGGRLLNLGVSAMMAVGGLMVPSILAWGRVCIVSVLNIENKSHVTYLSTFIIKSKMNYDVPV
jgi:hypothetical protein